MEPDRETGRRGKNVQAFTLVELLVVIAIISVLAGMLLPVLENALNSARQVFCMSNQKQIGTGFMMYINENADWWPSVNWDEDGDGDVDYKDAMYWVEFMKESGHLPESTRDGSGTFDFGLYCPTRAERYANGDPLYPDNNTDYAIALNQAWSGGGLRGVTEDYSSCRNSQIPNPSTFLVLGERWHGNLVHSTIFQDWRDWPTLGDTIWTLGPYMHDPNSNYLNADGHVESISWEELRFSRFMLFPEDNITRAAEKPDHMGF